MKHEFEAKFIKINEELIKDFLKESGGILKKSKFLMRRVVFNTDLPGKWIRI